MAKAKYTVTLTPFNNFGGRSKVRFGVGEEIKIDVKEEPAAKPPTPMMWSVKSGPASVHNAKPPGAGTVQCGNKAGAVELELRNTADKSLLASKRFEVVATEEAIFKKPVEELHIAHGAGFRATIILLPKDVSFKWVETREGAAPYEGSGCFAKAKAEKAEVATSYAVIHPVMGDWFGCKGGGPEGTEALGPDTVSTAVPPGSGPGTFVWNIPWFYRVHGVSGDFRFCTAVHKAVVDATGKITVSKLNVSVEKHI